MKIFLTKFVWDEVQYEGPKLIANTLQEEELIAEGTGLIVVGEMDDLVVTEAGLETLH